MPIEKGRWPFRERSGESSESVKLQVARNLVEQLEEEQNEAAVDVGAHLEPERLPQEL